MSFHVGEDIGNYRITSILGAGSMGQVFGVEHRITKRKEAMKVLLAEVASECQIQRFTQEIEIQARLDHPHIARVHNALHVRDCLVLVMELVEGQSLERLLGKGALPRAIGIGYIRQMLSALSYAHARGVVHRDITPANLIIDSSGNVKLTDFGVAKSLGDCRLINTGEIVGSLYYMAPEQFRSSSQPDRRSDLYSAGAVLYEVLTGKKLFEDSDTLSLMVAEVQKPQKPPVAPVDIDRGIGPELNSIVLKALAKDPEQRYQCAEEFLAALNAASRPTAWLAPESLARLVSGVKVGTVAMALCLLAGTGSLNVAEIHPPAAVVAASPLPPSLPPAHDATPPAAPRPSPPVSTTTSRRTVHAARPPATVPPSSNTYTPAETLASSVEPQPPPSVSKKKGFWRRLDPFHRKKPDRNQVPLPY